MLIDTMTVEYEVLQDGNRYDILGIDDGSNNYNHCLLTITNADGLQESFDCWNSNAKPEDTSAENIRCMLHCVCDDGLNALWEEWDALQGIEFSVGEAIANACRENLRKLENLGFTEDDMLEVVNAGWN